MNILNFSLNALNTITTTSVTNVGYLNYNFSISPNQTQQGSVISNPVNTIIIDDNTSIEKFVDKNIIQTGQEVTYTILIKNNDPSNVVSNIIFRDTIPPTTVFVQNSFTVNSITYPGQSPQNGINLGLNLTYGQIATITFKVVGTAPDGQFINSGSMNYTLNLLGQSLPGEKNSNTVTTLYRNLLFTITKYNDKIYADTGDIISYTLVVLNTGNVDLENVIITDTIPIGTSLVNNSTTVNGVPISSNPQNGISISSIPKYSSSTITFKVIIL